MYSETLWIVVVKRFDCVTLYKCINVYSTTMEKRKCLKDYDKIFKHWIIMCDLKQTIVR